MAPSFSRWTVYAAGSVAGLGGGNLLRAPGQHAIAVAKTDFERQRVSRCLHALDVAIHIQAGMIGQNILWLGKDIFDKGRRNDAKRDFAIDAAEGQVVNLVAEGRNVRALAGIQIHRQHVLAIEIEMRSEVKRKRRVSALVLAQALAIDPDGGSGHGAFKIHEDALAPGLGRKFEAAAVAGDEFIAFFVKAVPGQADVGMRNHDALISGVVEIAGVRAFRHGATEAPVAIHGQHQASGCGVGLRSGSG